MGRTLRRPVMLGRSSQKGRDKKFAECFPGLAELLGQSRCGCGPQAQVAHTLQVMPLALEAAIWPADCARPPGWQLIFSGGNDKTKATCHAFKGGGRVILVPPRNLRQPAAIQNCQDDTMLEGLCGTVTWAWVGAGRLNTKLILWLLVIKI